MRRFLPIAAVTVAVFFLGLSSAWALTSEQRCSAGKAHAVAAAVVCVAKQLNNELLSGSPADIGRCDAKLTSSFSIAESGSCSTSGDAPDAFALVEQTSTNLLAALGAGDASTDESKRCVVAKNKSAARYAACAAKRWARVFIGTDPPLASDDDRCFSKMVDGFARAERSGACPTTGDSAVSRRSLGGVSAYLPGADLHHENLAGAFAAGARLAGANLYWVNLRDADLRDADLSGATLESTVVDGADVTGTNFDGADLTRFHAYGVTGCPAGLPPYWTCTGGVLIGPDAHVGGDDLSGMDLSGLRLNGIYAYGGVEFVGTNLADADLTGASLGGADLTGADLSRANLTNASLSSSTLQDANLTNALLTNASFYYSSVEGADFSGVDLSSASLIQSRWVGLLVCPAALPPAYRCEQNTIFGPGVFVTYADAGGADLSGVDLSYAYVTDTDLTGANLAGSNLTGVDVTRTSFAGADVSDAILNLDYWGFATTCPDGTNTNSNGGSCCGHHAGGAPAACTPP